MTPTYKKNKTPGIWIVKNSEGMEGWFFDEPIRSDVGYGWYTKGNMIIWLPPEQAFFPEIEANKPIFKEI